jgi:hypothetical protein
VLPSSSRASALSSAYASGDAERCTAWATTATRNPCQPGTLSTPRETFNLTVIRRGMIWSVVVAGLVIGFPPFGLTLRVNQDFGAWKVILDTTLTNFGTRLLLGATLFYLEPKFIKSVSAAAAATAKSGGQSHTQARPALGTATEGCSECSVRSNLRLVEAGAFRCSVF